MSNKNLDSNYIVFQSCARINFAWADHYLSYFVCVKKHDMGPRYYYYSAKDGVIAEVDEYRIKNKLFKCGFYELDLKDSTMDLFLTNYNFLKTYTLQKLKENLDKEWE